MPQQQEFPKPEPIERRALLALERIADALEKQAALLESQEKRLIHAASQSRAETWAGMELEMAALHRKNAQLANEAHRATLRAAESQAAYYQAMREQIGK